MVVFDDDREMGAWLVDLLTDEGYIAEAYQQLFLDEIGAFPLPLQAKLLRVLEDKAVRPLGATHSATVNVRVIAATNRDFARP